MISVMKAAEKIARSQPRQTNRSKWKETASFRPMNLLPATIEDVTLLFHENVILNPLYCSIQ